MEGKGKCREKTENISHFDSLQVWQRNVKSYTCTCNNSRNSLHVTLFWGHVCASIDSTDQCVKTMPTNCFLQWQKFDCPLLLCPLCRWLILCACENLDSRVWHFTQEADIISGPRPLPNLRPMWTVATTF